jgi:hypothetical protein
MVLLWRFNRSAQRSMGTVARAGMQMRIQRRNTARPRSRFQDYAVVNIVRAQAGEHTVSIIGEDKKRWLEFKITLAWTELALLIAE